MRWGLLMAFQTPDPDAAPAKWANGVSPHWAVRLEAEGRLSAGARRVFEADNPIAWGILSMWLILYTYSYQE